MFYMINNNKKKQFQSVSGLTVCRHWLISDSRQVVSLSEGKRQVRHQLTRCCTPHHYLYPTNSFGKCNRLADFRVHRTSNNSSLQGTYFSRPASMQSLDPPKLPMTYCLESHWQALPRQRKTSQSASIDQPKLDQLWGIHRVVPAGQS